MTRPWRSRSSRPSSTTTPSTRTRWPRPLRTGSLTIPGAATRAAPIGAYFAPDFDRVRTEALRSAAPTHAHPDGAAGAVAVAIAAALASTRAVSRDAFVGEVARWTPAGKTHDRLVRADELGLSFDVAFAGEELGTGANIT